MEFAENLLCWYDAHKRSLPWRQTRDPYRIFVSEIMLQQTRVSAVLGYYERFLGALPDIAALADAEEDTLNKLWEGLGYYRRAQYMKRAAGEIMQRHGGVFPTQYADIRALCGVGDYTAGAVASIAFGTPVPAVDGNVLRVLARYCGDATDITRPEAKAKAAAWVMAHMDCARAGDFNAALMELGALICTPNGAPHCEECPLRTDCVAKRTDRIAFLPHKSPRKPRRIEEKTVFVLRENGVPAIKKRAAGGLLAGLWELPNTAGLLEPEAAGVWLSAHGVLPAGELLCYMRRHIFTHVEWHMRVYALEARMELQEGWCRWRHEALPTAFRVCLPQQTAEGTEE